VRLKPRTVLELASEIRRSERRAMKNIILAVVIATLAPVSASAQGTPQQRRVCKDDAYRLCPWEVPHPARTERCMRAHIKSLSPACRAEFGR